MTEERHVSAADDEGVASHESVFAEGATELRGLKTCSRCKRQLPIRRLRSVPAQPAGLPPLQGSVSGYRR